MNYGNFHLVIWLIGIGYWIINWAGNKKTVQRDRTSGRWAFLALFIVGVSVFRHSRGWLQQRVVPDDAVVQILGVLACAAGVAIAIWARYILGRNWSAVPTIKEGHELITSGPYQWVRHPIYTGILLALFGTMVLGGGRVWQICAYGFMAIGLHFKSRVEEGFMMQTFPDSYPAYRQRTKAIIPYIL
ncbi:MAG TPA: isoprenylcysteine carboxylmethyltransferase family protein [Opitutales bacterium]|nr:isoprenylcysteine carboxylmethyltransferase family protein [Opitutales bacterium]